MESRDTFRSPTRVALNPAPESNESGARADRFGDPDPCVPRWPGRTPAKGQVLPASDTQTEAASRGLVCFSLASGKTPKPPPGSENPRLTAPAVRGPEVKLKQRRKQPVLAPGPRGTGWIPPVGSGACAHPGASGLRSGEGEGRAATWSWTPGGCQRHNMES